MKIVTDFHIHSRFARGCSKRLTVEGVWKECIKKGIGLIGTGDFTHPERLAELEEYLETNENGFLIPKHHYREQWIEDIKVNLSQQSLERLQAGEYPFFVLQTEINNAFERNGKKYRIHNCLFIDSLEKAKGILEYLSGYGDVTTDGRLSVRQEQSETLFNLKKMCPELVFFPAHIWTPYFGVLGSKFGFSSMKEAFGDSYFLVDGFETGLSSDPVMNWINSELEPFSIISTSDAHSLENFGREATVFETEEEGCGLNDITYKDLEKAIKYRKFRKFPENLHSLEKEYLEGLFQKNGNLRLASTIEFYPQEGKYFGDGHSKCNFLTQPDDTIERNGVCPICGGKITVGVFHRCYDLGEKKRIDAIDFGSKYFFLKYEIERFADFFDREKFYYVVPLWNIIKEVWNVNRGTKRSISIYNDLIKKFGNEFFILLDLSVEKALEYDESFGKALEQVRKGDINIQSGFDGIFGVVSLYPEYYEGTEEEKEVYKQQPLFGS